MSPRYLICVIICLLISEMRVKRESQVFGQILSTRDWQKLTKIVTKLTSFVKAAACPR